MKRAAVISFTARGMELSRRIRQELEAEKFCAAELYTKYSGKAKREEDICFVEEPLKEWAKKRFAQKETLIFVGACGIAVRSIAPYVQDKLKDSPVLVVDEAGAYVIPVLSGHYGGGNELAVLLAARIGAVPVITTATDVCGLFAVDVFARKNNLTPGEKKGITRVSAKILKEKHITMRIEGEVRGEAPPEVELCDAGTKSADVVVAAETAEGALLQLYPRAVILGMGCKKGKTCGEIEAFVLEKLKELRIPMAAVRALATIDAKGAEPGFLEFTEKYGLSFLTYPKERLAAVKGNFASSSFVKEQMGVDNVCERAAVAGGNVKILLEKTAKDGMTLAVAEEKWSVNFYEA